MKFLTWLYFPNQWKRVTGEGETMAWLLLFLLFHGCSCLVFSHPTLQFLPGFTGPLPFQLETGYVGVDENEIVQLFYYFIKSERNFREDPLMLWLTGGPGCSAISSLAFEIGPLSFKAVEYNGSLPTLLLNPYSWTKVASIIFVDSPVGTGFSYSKTPPASPPSDFGQVDSINQFLKKWLIIHPEFLLNPLYIGGSSYSGIPLPALVQQISNENEQGIKPLRNLQGYVLGSPMTDLTSFRKFRFLFAHGMGLISDEIYEAWKSNCEGGNPSNKECTRAVEAYEMCTSELYENYILAPSCDFASPKPQQSFSERRSLTSHYFHDSQLSVPTLGCPTYGYLLADYWANDYSVRQALHIHEGSIEKWRRCNKNMPYIRDIQNSIPYHANLSVKGYRSLIYNGDHDLTMPFLGTQAWIRSLNYSIVDDWRPWMLSGQVAGYTRTYSNKMTFATIKGGGHTTMFRPEESSVMFKRWISGEPL
ncbi:serine carboxypeptidase-like 17 [Carica papaya]|uniref:serine carboxypeptidase-like 17 n=1 Tax=Carica papaya TaxID=3649 RepID=UPI000B8CB56B|nr:serine carboxypeptidase-like 17 [Carica papaya]